MMQNLHHPKQLKIWNVSFLMSMEEIMDWDDFFEYWAEEHEPSDIRPEFVWSTEPVKINIDAQGYS